MPLLKNPSSFFSKQTFKLPSSKDSVKIMKSMFNLKLNSHTLLNWNLKTQLSIRRKPKETLMGTHTPCGLLACKCDQRASWTMNQTPHLLCYLWK
jgi:hypothetical protein